MAPEVVGSNPIFHPKSNRMTFVIRFFYAQAALQACLHKRRGHKKRCASAHQVAHERAPAASGNGNAQPARASTIPPPAGVAESRPVNSIFRCYVLDGFSVMWTKTVGDTLYNALINRKM